MRNDRDLVSFGGQSESDTVWLVKIWGQSKGHLYHLVHQHEGTLPYHLSEVYQEKLGMWILNSRYRTTVLRSLRLLLHWKLWFYFKFYPWNALCPKMNIPHGWLLTTAPRFGNTMPRKGWQQIPRHNRSSRYTSSSQRPLDIQNMQLPSDLETHSFLNLWKTNVYPLRWQAALALSKSLIKPHPLHITINFHGLACLLKTTIKRTDSKLQPHVMNISSIFDNNIYLLYSWKISFRKSRMKSKR